ncbi:MAG: DUF1957 domain-containing protein [Treponema sp.]|nr:DUF1957 domain-containing protein [Treponema sp.]
MASKSLVLLISDDQEYIRHIDKDEKKFAPEMNRLYESISNVYIPLLKMFESLEKDMIPFKIALVLSPSLCTLFCDPVVQRQYMTWLDRRIAFGKRELKNHKGDSKLVELIKFHLEKAQEDKLNFTSVFGQNILAKFFEYEKKGYVELLATCGTNIFLPHYADMEEILNAQVETGLYAHCTFFGEQPTGFWLPEMGYMPGIERVLRAYGVRYTVLDTRAFLFSNDEIEKGIFAPVECASDIVAFARDSRVDREVFGESGFASGGAYCDVNRDIAFELPLEALSDFFENGTARYASGFRYWSKSEKQYDIEVAEHQCQIDASSFVARKYAMLENAQSLLPESRIVSLVCTFSASRFAQNWIEGIEWLEHVFRCGSMLSFSSFKNILAEKEKLQHVRPYYSSTNGWGYGEALLTQKNDWMIRHVRKASERMVDLAERFPDDTGLKAHLLNVASRELMLAQSCGWANMLWEGNFPEYAAKRFNESIAAFTTVFESLGSNSVNTEWLTNLEAAHPIFPWINYRIFCKKK